MLFSFRITTFVRLKGIFPNWLPKMVRLGLILDTIRQKFGYQKNVIPAKAGKKK